MSQSIRLAKSSFIAVRGLGDLLTYVSAEQAAAKSDFPGPLPVLYVQPFGESLEMLDVPAVAAAGASAVMLVAPTLLPCSAAELDVALAALAPAVSAATEAGLEVVIELALADGAGVWDAAAAEAALAKVEASTKCALLVLALRGSTVQPLPAAFQGRTLASIRVPWPDISDICEGLRQEGYAGALLRSECMPLAASKVPDWADFWANIIANAKSNKSRNVIIMVARQKTTDAMAAYVAKVRASGQFGDSMMGGGASLGGSDPIDTTRGDWLGF
ncbi:hypothetical protein T492DRAFT_833649 [Pavlovales sp. CCMP2436]|nr:hypothetical protein T492DRAFT_833649 [Pavlovales sp. CCMP2436]